MYCSDSLHVRSKLKVLKRPQDEKQGYAKSAQGFEKLDGDLADACAHDAERFSVNGSVWFFSATNAVSRVTCDVSQLWRLSEPAAAAQALNRAISWLPHPVLLSPVVLLSPRAPETSACGLAPAADHCASEHGSHFRVSANNPVMCTPTASPLRQNPTLASLADDNATIAAIEGLLVSNAAAVRVLAAVPGSKSGNDFTPRPPLGSPARFSSNKVANSKAINEALHG
jgi:hypothetical protein